MKLDDSRVLRGGVTSPYMVLETTDIKATANNNNMQISFQMSSKGGGHTRVWVEVGVGDFRELIRRMARVDRQATLSAITDELARQIDREPELLLEAEATGREQVKEIAAQRYYDAPVDNDEDEKFVLDVVKEIIGEFENEGKKKVA